ncbi:MAG: hypothetical protein ACI85I_000778 [Arenicella sp.]|jgi:hypothetical protein
MISKNQLQKFRQVGDDLADKLIAQIYADKENSSKIRQLMSVSMRNDEPIPADLPDYVHEYFRESAKLPNWANLKQMERGAKFFEANAQEVMALLGYYSLPYCYAAANGAKVLWMSERIQKDTLKRLTETGQFVFDVSEVSAFNSEGFAIRSIQKVRLIHAAIRYHVQKTGSWDSEVNGLPVNQEDMAGTNLAFSLITLRGMRKIGKRISAIDSEAFLHLWNVISYMLGVDEQLVPKSGNEAYLLEKAIAERNIRPSEEGKLLTQSLLNGFSADPPVPFPKGYHESFMRFLMGNEVADILEIPDSNWTSKLVTFQKYFNNIFSVFQSNYRESRAKSLALIKKNTVERQEVDKSFTFPNSLGVD